MLQVFYETGVQKIVHSCEVEAILELRRSRCQQVEVALLLLFLIDPFLGTLPLVVDTVDFFWMTVLSGVGCCAAWRIFPNIFLLLDICYDALPCQRVVSYNQEQLIKISKAQIILQLQPQIPDELKRRHHG
ncbi:hypothetical protein ILYODFUR_032385 [Ilyodon furcidens]|uniref:Uncharacterized protein n=1 Tax=Ilyodon furcidens TaxID=33524 RepID=A0ABV0TNL3_9TELE